MSYVIAKETGSKEKRLIKLQSINPQLRYMESSGIGLGSCRLAFLNFSFSPSETMVFMPSGHPRRIQRDVESQVVSPSLPSSLQDPVGSLNPP